MKKIALLLFIFAFSSVSAYPQVISEILKRIESNRKALKSLSADIRIEKASAQSAEKYTKEGTVKFALGKNDYFLRIDSTKPAPESFSIINNQYLLYLADLKQLFLPDAKIAYTGQITELQKNALFIFTTFLNLPTSELKRDYNIQYFGQDRVNNSVPVLYLALLPKTPKSYTKVELWVDVNGMPLQSKVFENKDAWTLLTLNRLQKNAYIKSGDFKIDLPKNIKTVAN
jgi:outer membrane lipoprotein-sorting protein